MASLKYRVREDAAGCLWEVFTDDGRTIASGAEGSDTAARTAAMLEGMRALSSSSSDDPAGQVVSRACPLMG
jgi:hypothetical protein